MICFKTAEGKSGDKKRLTNNEVIMLRVIRFENIRRVQEKVIFNALYS